MLAITMGDPASIGPEILYKAYLELKPSLKKSFIIYGDPKAFAKQGILVEPEFLSYFAKSSLNLDYQVGELSKEAGIYAYYFLEESVKAVLANQVSAILNGPINKYAISLSEANFLGHTTYYEERISTFNKRALMSFCGKYFNLCLLTHHIPLNEISKTLANLDLEVEIIKGIRGFKKLLNRSFKSCILGPNPHAGENGLLSLGEEELINNALTSLSKKGYQIDGPFASDSFFSQENLKKYDLVFACYHDQGLIPFKLLHYPGGVSLTFGLKVHRATVDHGTAYSLVGKDEANYQSFKEAWQLLDLA